ncbi:hypothetical protein F4823DRAFT_419108 [Ustulina deusta]|nr:hypothetical protein F4823DRAFT_419108 [Ustulina deusta]
MPSRPAPNIDLGQHSLNAVVGRNKALWQSPPKWTQAHLEALCIDRQSVADLDDVDGDQDDGLSFHAVIPTLPPDRLRRSINTLNGPDSSWLLVQALDKMLAFWPRPSKPQHDDVDVDNHVKLSSSPRLDIEPPAFSHFQKCTVKLRVGPRAYPLRLLFSFHLGSLVLPFFDAFTIDNHDYLAHRRHLSNEPYEPYITAILIALAQTKPFSTWESAVVVSHRFPSTSSPHGIHADTHFVSLTPDTAAVWFAPRRRPKHVHLYRIYISAPARALPIP